MEAAPALSTARALVFIGFMGAGKTSAARAAAAALGAAPRGTKLLWATTASGDYPVHVGEGLLASGFWPVAGRRFLVTDETVGALYAAALGPVAAEVRIPPG